MKDPTPRRRPALSLDLVFRSLTIAGALLAAVQAHDEVAAVLWFGLALGLLIDTFDER